MVSELLRIAVRRGPEWCPDWFGLLSGMRRNGRLKEWSDAAETARVSARFGGSNESRKSRTGHPNGTTKTNHASDPRNPPTQISESALVARDRPQLRFGRQYRWRLRQAR